MLLSSYPLYHMTASENDVRKVPLIWRHTADQMIYNQTSEMNQNVSDLLTKDESRDSSDEFNHENQRQKHCILEEVRGQVETFCFL